MPLPSHRAPVHPGEILEEEFLKPGNVSQAKLACHLGWAPTRLNEIIKGKRGVTPESALLLADAVGMSPGFWLGLQQDYDLWHAQQHHVGIGKMDVFKEAS